MPFGHQTAYVRTDVMKAEKFDTSFKSSGDYKFFYQAYKNNKRFMYIPKMMAIFEADSGISVTSLHGMRENARIYGINKTVKWNLYFMKFVVLRNIKSAIRKTLTLNQTTKNYMIERTRKNLCKFYGND
jgi:hypothetical protein